MTHALQYMALQMGQQHGPMGGSNLYLIVLLLVIVVAVVVALLLLFPRLQTVRPTKNLRRDVERQRATEVQDKGEEDASEETMEIALRLLQPDERRIVEVILDEGGTMLQKDISHELGFSRVKTHRVLKKLIERGIVEAQEYYNTNKITLTEWLTPSD